MRKPQTWRFLSCVFQPRCDCTPVNCFHLHRFFTFIQVFTWTLVDCISFNFLSVQPKGRSGVNVLIVVFHYVYSGKVSHVLSRLPPSLAPMMTIGSVELLLPNSQLTNALWSAFEVNLVERRQAVGVMGDTSQKAQRQETLLLRRLNIPGCRISYKEIALFTLNNHFTSLILYEINLINALNLNVFQTPVVWYIFLLENPERENAGNPSQ